MRVEIHDRYDEFYPILLNNKARFGLKPTHSYDDLIRNKRATGRDKDRLDADKLESDRP